MSDLDRFLSVGRVAGQERDDLDRFLGRNQLPTGLPELPRQPGALARVGQFGVRTVAGLLEPIQLPKDVLDAIVVGSADDKSTISERLGRIEWLKYAPLGASPARPATGREFAEAVGLKGAGAVGVGFAWDILGDPLLVGGFVSGLGRAARLAGAAETGAQLMRTGRAIDHALSPAFLGSKTYEAFRLAPGVERMERYATSAFNGWMDARVFWERGPEARTWSDFMMPRSRALGRQLPNQVAGEVDGLAMGHRLFVGEQRGQQLGRDVEITMMSLLQDANQTLLGSASLPLLQRQMRRMSQAIRGTHAPEMEALPTVLRDVIYRSAYDVNDSIGIGVWRSLPPNLPSELHRTVAGVSLVSGTATMSKGQARVLQQARERIVKAAEKAGFDPSEALRRFDYFRFKTQAADALSGYYNSGYEPILQKWLENMNVAGVDNAQAMNMWREIRHRVQGGESFKSITTLGGREIAEAYPGWKNAAGRQVETVEDMVSFGGMGGAEGFYGLNLEAYLRSLETGHMTRTYAMFASDAGDYDGFLRQMKDGKVIANNVFNHTQPGQLLPQSFQAEEKLIRDYVDAVAFPARSTSSGATPRGLLVKQADLAQHLLDNNVPAARVREVMSEFIDSLAGNATHMKNIRKADYLMADYKRTRGLTQAATSGGTSVWGRRNRRIEELMLTYMGEQASPLVSLQSAARETRMRLPWSSYLTQAYDEGLRAGYIKTKPYTDPVSKVDFTAIPKDPEIWGAFAGKRVHPFLHKELERLLRARTENRGNAFQRLRSLITGGYLASPNVIAANFFGGVYTSALAGVSPADFVPEIMTSWRQFQKASANPAYVFRELDDLKRYIGVDRTSLVDASIEKSITALRGVINAQDTSDLRRTFNGLVEAVQGQLDAPLGQRWAGLDGFQFIENLMKVSAFSAQRKRLAFENGIDMAEFLKPVAQQSQVARAIEARAAEIARRSVFDYSDLPESLRVLRDTGLMLFPGFSYFIIGRTLEAALERPGVLASADRISGAIASLALPDEDERLALYASMPEWLVEDQGVPLPFFGYTAEDGSRRNTVIPFNQLVPTNPIGGNPLMESLVTGGIYRPLLEVGVAHAFTGGEAYASGQYGQRVFSRGADWKERIGQSAAYVLNSFAPGILRKTVGTYHPDRGITGGILSEQGTYDFGKRLWSEVSGRGVPVSEEMNRMLYSWQEIQSRRADKRLSDLLLSATLRSPQVITTGGGLLATVRNVVDQERAVFQAEVGRLRAKAQTAMRNGNPELALEYYQQIGERQRLWAEQIMPRYQAASYRAE